MHFFLDWTNIYGYCFPPFSVIAGVLQKIQADKPQKCIIVAPVWTTQPWFTTIMEMLIDYPRVLPNYKASLQIQGSDKVHPLYPKMILMACLLSGEPSKVAEFQKQLPTSLCRHGDQALKNNIQYISGDGFYTVVKIYLNDGLDFLAEEYKKGLSYSALNTARSALSSFILLKHEPGFAFGKHPLVIRFIKAVHNLQPPVCRYTDTWDVDIVLSYIRRMDPVRYLSLKDLTLKLVMLLGILSIARAQGLRYLSLDNMKVYMKPMVFKAYPINRIFIFFDFIECFTTTFLRAHSWLNWVAQ